VIRSKPYIEVLDGLVLDWDKIYRNVPVED
jgi:hypothetical protein